MNKLFSFLQITIFLSHIQNSLSYSFTGNEIRDLNKNDSSFSYDVQRWSSSTFLQGLDYTVCSGTYLLGGYGIMGQAGIPATDIYLQRIYNQLPSHTMIHFTFTLWALDTWNGNSGDSFQLEFDWRVFTGWMFNMLNFPMGNQVCGLGQAKDLNNIRVFGRIYHSGGTLVFKLKSQLDQWPTDESFGIRDLSLLFVSNPPTTRESMCAIASITLDSNQCLCSEGQYETIPGSGICSDCDPRCKSCFAGDSRSCYECAPGTYFNGQACLICSQYCAMCSGEGINQCFICQTGYYMHLTGPGGVCLKTCDPPLFKYFTGTIGYCQTTSCSSPNLVKFDGTCVPASACTTPLQQSFIGSMRLCINPCSIGEYLYWDGSCRPSCESPLQIISQTGVNYCDTGCSGYFYEDGTCLSSCTPPLVPKTQGIRLFCVYPCQLNQYLYGNSSCMDTCPPPFEIKETNGFRYCDYNCLATEFLAWNGSCVASCDPPLIIDSQSVGKLCLPPCGSLEMYYSPSAGTCSQECNLLSRFDPRDLYPTCLPFEPPADDLTAVDPLLSASTKPNTVTFVSLTRLLHPLRYLDITYPPRLQTFVSHPTRSPLCITPFIAIPHKVEARFPLQAIPAIFADRGLHSSFFVNFWQETISFFIVAAALVIFFSLEKTSEEIGSNCLQVFFERLRVIFGCSYLFVLFGSSAGDLFLFGFLELRAMDLSHALGVFSLGMALFILTMLAIFVNKILEITGKVQQAKKDAFFKRSDGLYMSALIQWQNYQVFFRGFRQHFKSNNYFYFIYILRVIGPMMIAAFIYQVPLLQAILYVVINLGIIGYITFAQPLRSTLNFIQLLLVETLTLAINIVALLLVVYTLRDSSSIYKVFLGDLIIFGNDVINFTLCVFFVLKVLLGVRNACRMKKNQSDMTQDSWCQLLFIPLQQGGFGFERARVARFPRIHVKQTNDKMDIIQQIEDEGVSANDSFIFSKEKLNEDETAYYKEEELILHRKPRVKYSAGMEDEVEIFGVTRETKNQEFLSEAIAKATEALAINLIHGFNPRAKKPVEEERDLTIYPFDINQSSIFPMSNTHQDLEIMQNDDVDNQLPVVDGSKHFSYLPKRPPSQEEEEEDEEEEEEKQSENSHPVRRSSAYIRAKLNEDEFRRKMSGINEVTEEDMDISKISPRPRKSLHGNEEEGKEGTMVLGIRLGDFDQELPPQNNETPKKIQEKLRLPSLPKNKFKDNETPKQIREKLKLPPPSQENLDFKKSESPKKIKEKLRLPPPSQEKLDLKNYETPKKIVKESIKLSTPVQNETDEEDEDTSIQKIILPESNNKEDKISEIEKEFLEKLNQDLKTAKEIPPSEIEVLFDLPQKLKKENNSQRKPKDNIPPLPLQQDSQRLSSRRVKPVEQLIDDPDKDFEQTFLQGSKTEMSKFISINKIYEKLNNKNDISKDRDNDDFNIVNASFDLSKKK